MSTALIPPTDWKPVGIPGLEPDALKAVKATGNTLVTAGPGAGKTELLGQRGVFLLQTPACIYPRRVLAISYKRDAARNLRERFQKRCDKEQARRLDSMTFDAFAKQILDRFWRALPDPWKLSGPYKVSGFVSRPQFLDFQRSCAANINTVGHPINWVITLARKGLTSADIYAVNQDKFNLSIQDLELSSMHTPSAAALMHIAYIRQAYTNAIVPLTFQMIGRLAQLLIESNPRIRAAIVATYSHVFLDEMQDTTGVQYGLLRSIFLGSDTVLTAVGDDKQRIMGWAGAHTNGFGAFASDFLAAGAAAGQEHITLSINYRSNERIVGILNILKANIAPHEPDFRAARPTPPLPAEQICSLIYSPNETAEAEALVVLINSLLSSGTSAREIGLLVRQRTVDIEERLKPFFENAGIRLRNEDRDVGGASIQDLMTEPYAQLITECLDLLMRKRGGGAWARVLENMADMDGLIDGEDEEPVAKLAARLDAFHSSNFIADADKAIAGGDAVELIDRIDAFFGIPILKAMAPQYQQGDFFDNIRKATRAFMAECADHSSTWRASLARYRGDDQVPLLTITKSKGLEYDSVILLGLDDDQWWSFANNPQEGHSTFFVAASRAKERLFMTLCADKKFGKLKEIYALLERAGVSMLNSETILKQA
ncbi:MAG: ATP-dependent helicase [Hyphomicrobium sp.]|jgi:superfamily I DNA/RNA helicase